MKMKILLFGLLTAIGSGSMSFLLTKKHQVPQVVRDAFAAKYPEAQKVNWEEETDYEAAFRLQGSEMSATFTAHGQWLETEREVKKSELPEAVKSAIKKDFPGYSVEEAERLETPNMPLAFEVELEYDTNHYEVEAVYSAEGNLVKKEMENDHEKEDDKGGR